MVWGLRARLWASTVAVRVLVCASAGAVGALVVHAEPCVDQDQQARCHSKCRVLSHPLLESVEWLVVRHRGEEIDALGQTFKVEPACRTDC